MSRADGLYTAVQRQVINQMLKAAASDDKKKIVRAFRLAETIPRTGGKARSDSSATRSSTTIRRSTWPVTSHPSSARVAATASSNVLS
jgi:hypothetical protein